MEWLNDVNLLVGVTAGVIGVFTGYSKAVKAAEEKGSKIAEIKVMISTQTDLLREVQEKLDESAKDRKELYGDIKTLKEQVKTLFNNYDELKKIVDKIEHGGK